MIDGLIAAVLGFVDQIPALVGNVLSCFGL